MRYGRRHRHGRFLIKHIALSIVVILCIGSVAWFLRSKLNIFLFPSKPYISPLSKIAIETFALDMNSKGVVEEKVKSLLSQKNIPYNSVVFKDQSEIAIILKNEEEIWLSQSKTLEEQISSLQFMLSRLTIEGKSFTKIDLRFERPVILFKITPI